MQIEKELAEIATERDTLLTIGVFDGVHLGHKHLIAQLTEQSRKENLLSGVITFKQHPRHVISPGIGPQMLTTLDERIKLLKDEGIDIVVPLFFTPELAKLGAREFVSLLKKYLRMRGLVIGPNFALGRNREGNVDALRKLGQELGFTVMVVSPLMANGEVVSSTLIRKLLADGDVKKASRLMGHSISLRGQVTTGAGRGVKLGFPTANLGIDALQAIPADGVYVTQTHVNGKVYESVTNIGWNPTFGSKERTVETFIIDYKDNLYGRELKIDIIERLRGEKRFGNVEELKKQIAEDIEQAKTILENR